MIAPYRYTEESAEKLESKQLVGTYKYINHGRDISPDMKESEELILNKNNTLSGALEGTWELSGDYNITLKTDEAEYKGIA